jgi:hypothetical protein
VEKRDMPFLSEQEQILAKRSGRRKLITRISESVPMPRAPFRRTASQGPPEHAVKKKRGKTRMRWRSQARSWQLRLWQDNELDFFPGEAHDDRHSSLKLRTSGNVVDP